MQLRQQDQIQKVLHALGAELRKRDSNPPCVRDASNVGLSPPLSRFGTARLRKLFMTQVQRGWSARKPETLSGS